MFRTRRPKRPARRGCYSDSIPPPVDLRKVYRLFFRSALFSFQERGRDFVEPEAWGNQTALEIVDATNVSDETSETAPRDAGATVIQSPPVDLRKVYRLFFRSALFSFQERGRGFVEPEVWGNQTALEIVDATNVSDETSETTRETRVLQ